jgi:AcrR family transcriptional regulator
MVAQRRRPTTAKKKAGKREAYHHGDLRRALLAEARRLIAAQGADAFKVREAARGVGVTHRAVYRHFADKRALLAELAAEGFDALRSRLEQAAAKATTADPIDRVRRIGAAYVAFALDDPTRFHLMFGPRLNEDRRFPELEESIAGTLSLVQGTLRSGIDAGAIRDDDPQHLALSLWTAVHGFAELVLQRRIHTRSKKAALGYVGVNLAPLLDGLRRH